MAFLMNAIEDDFSTLLHYVADHKITVTPKQQLFPLRHIKDVMRSFKTQVEHEHRVGDRVYKRKSELEYQRFYFLDLLAVSGGFIEISGRNQLKKGPHWNAYFEVAPGERGLMLFHAFRYSFSFVNWLLCGGDFGEQMDSRSQQIWLQILTWRNEIVTDWKSWAKQIVFLCGLHWNSKDQMFAEELAIWGIEQCIIMPFEYFGFIEDKKEEGEFRQLKSFRLSSLGREYLSRFPSKSGSFLTAMSPFSIN